MARLSVPMFIKNNLILSLCGLSVIFLLFSTPLQAQNSRYNKLLQKYTKLGESGKIQVLMDSNKQNLTFKELLSLLKNTASLTASEKSVYQDMLQEISSRNAADIRTKLSFVQGLSPEQNTSANSALANATSVLTEYEVYLNFGGGFYYYDLYKYSYDNNLNLIEDLYQFYDSTAGWVNGARWLYSYDSFNRDTLEINEGWDPDSQKWLSYAKFSNTYNEGNNLLYTHISQWADPEWALWGRTLYTYDANSNALEVLSQMLAGSDWVNDGRTTYTYDANNNLLSDIYETWNGDAWQEFIKFEQTYDVNNNVTSGTFSIFGNHAFRDVYTYDSNNNIISDSNYNWNSTRSKWEIYFVQTNTFDVKNNLIHYLLELAEDSPLEDYLQYDAEFNDFNNLTAWQSYTRNGDNWVPRRKAEFSYDADQNLTLVKDSSSNDGGLTWSLFMYEKYTWSSGVTGVEDDKTLPSAFQLSQNYPNPFNPSTSINFSIPNKSNVSLKVFDLLGSQVAELFNGDIEAGSYSLEFNAAKLPSGIYFYRLQTDNFNETRKMVLLK